MQKNEEQTGGQRDIDLNIVEAWEQGYNGEGVVVTTLDDGIDHEHPDLRNNYVRLIITNMEQYLGIYWYRLIGHLSSIKEQSGLRKMIKV